MATATKPKTFDDVIKAARKKYSMQIGPMSEIATDVVAVTSGNVGIDTAIGVAGLPLGRSVELYGPPSSGKTTTALQAAAELQAVIKAGGDEAKGISADDKIMYMDHEQAMDVNYARALGLDVDHESFVFAQPDALEHSAQIAIDAINTGSVRMVIWDSVAAMNPEAAMEAEIGASLPAIQARVMGQFLRNLNGVLAENNCSALFINHLREKMVMGGTRPGQPTPTTTPGGAALKFYASLRIEYTPVGTVKGQVYDPLANEMVERVIATNVRVKVIKNKLAPPFRQAIVRVRYGRGFDNFWTALQLLIAHKRMVYSSGYFYFERLEDAGLSHPDMARQSTGNHRPYIQGEAAIFDFADTHPEWRQAMIDHAMGVLSEVTNALDAIVPTTAPVDDAEGSEAEAQGEPVIGDTVVVAGLAFTKVSDNPFPTDDEPPSLTNEPPAAPLENSVEPSLLDAALSKAGPTKPGTTVAFVDPAADD